jgi:DNA-directed RNA polymerase subunit N (RpoN/RPB10)
MESFDLFPVRCYSCNSVIGRHQGIYEELSSEGVPPGEIMDRLGVKRVCCRMNMLSPAKIILESSEKPSGSIAISRRDVKLRQEVDGLLSTVRSLDITEAPTLESTGVTESMSSEGKIESEPLPNIRTFSTGVGTQISPWNMPQTGHGNLQAPNNMGMARRPMLDPNTQFKVIQVKPAVQVSQPQFQQPQFQQFQPQQQLQPQQQFQQFQPQQQLQPQFQQLQPQQLQPQQLQPQQLQPQHTLAPIGSLPSRISTPPTVSQQVTSQQSGISASSASPIALIPTTAAEGTLGIGKIEAVPTLESLGI